jgi:hypothetical protein
MNMGLHSPDRQTAWQSSWQDALRSKPMPTLQTTRLASARPIALVAAP